MRISQIEIFRLLLDHILREKIEFATASTNNSLPTNEKQIVTPEIIPEELFEDTLENKLVVVEQIQKESDTSSIKGVITNETEKALLPKKECKYCGSTKNLEIEHIKAQSKGGLETTLACRTCNRSKQDKSLLTWLRWIKKNDKYRWRRIRNNQYKKSGDIADTVRKVSTEK